MSRVAEELTFNELCIICHRLFKTHLSSVENIQLKYVDEEKDLIDLETDLDIAHALSLSSTLKIHVYDSKNVLEPKSITEGLENVKLDQNTLDSLQATLTDLVERVSTVLQLLATKTSPQTTPKKILTKSELQDFLPKERPSQPSQQLSMESENKKESNDFKDFKDSTKADSKPSSSYVTAPSITPSVSQQYAPPATVVPPQGSYYPSNSYDPPNTSQPPPMYGYQQTSQYTPQAGYSNPSYNPQRPPPPNGDPSAHYHHRPPSHPPPPPGSNYPSSGYYR